MNSMYMKTRACKVLPNIITKVRGVATRLDFQDAPLNGSLRNLCTSETEDKHIPYSSKNLAQTKKEQCWCYDPTTKYEALRKCAVPRYAYHDDSTTDWTESSDFEIETDTMTEEETQNQKEKILAEAKEEQPFNYNPILNYDILKQFFYLDSPDSLAYSNLILDSDSKEVNRPKLDKYDSETIQRQLFFIGSDSDFKTKKRTEAETEVETESETVAEDETHEDKSLAGTKEEQLFRYDPSIIYEPLKRYIVPRFAFYDSSSTDWSDSSDISASSDFESEIETMAEEEAQSQEDKILAGPKDEQLFREDLVDPTSTNLQTMAEDLAKFPSRHLQSKPAVSESSFLALVNHGAKSLGEVGDKVIMEAKEIESYGGVEKVLIIS